MSDVKSPRSALSPVVIMFAGLVLLAGSIVAFFMAGRPGEDSALVSNEGPYRGIIFEAVAPVVLGEDARRRVLLMGAMHVLRPDDHPLPASYHEAFDLADVVFFELQPGEKAKAAELLTQRTIYPDGTTMRVHLPDALYDRASVKAEAMGISMDAMVNRRPYVLAQALSLSVLSRAGFTKAWGVDTYFRSKVKEQSKTVMGFETLAEQLTVFSELSDARHEALLQSTLDQMDRHSDYGIRGVSAWRSGDTEAMSAIYAESKPSDPQLARALFEDRHERWLPAIEDQLVAGKAVLVVVGAAHLCGEGSLVELLKERGYAVGQW